jgi:hypothetical protein
MVAVRVVVGASSGRARRGAAAGQSPDGRAALS